MTTETLVKPTFGQFTIERRYKHSPQRVYRAFEDPKAHYRWFVSGEGWEIVDWTADFRVGGRDHGHFRPEGAPFMLSNETHYLELVPGARIVVAYTMGMNGQPMSHSLATTEFLSDGAGCRLVFTEQGAYYGGPDDIKGRKEGCAGLFEKLAAELEAHA